MDHIDELAKVLARFPGIGPRQGKRFVYYLLSVLAAPARARPSLCDLSLHSEKMSASVLNACAFPMAVPRRSVTIVLIKRAMIRS